MAVTVCTEVDLRQVPIGRVGNMRGSINACTPWITPRARTPTPTEGEDGTGNQQESSCHDVAPLLPSLINMRIRGKFGAELLLYTLL